jgi:hypothetical protein
MVVVEKNREETSWQFAANGGAQPSSPRALSYQHHDFSFAANKDKPVRGQLTVLPLVPMAAERGRDCHEFERKD